MAEKQSNCSQSVENQSDMADKRLIPGGYITRQMVDEIIMASSEISRDIEAVTRISADPQETYRVIAKVAIQLGNIKSLAAELRKIME